MFGTHVETPVFPGRWSLAWEWSRDDDIIGLEGIEGTADATQFHAWV